MEVMQQQHLGQQQQQQKKNTPALISELAQGREMAKQLRNHLTPSASREMREVLLQKILSSYDNAISMLLINSGTAGTSLLTSPQGRSPPHDFNHHHQPPKDVYKKRKTMPSWTEQVRVAIGSSSDGHLDDGYGWRKYGQKDILGAKFPRGYYRCTHRHAQGCLATKQVQRSDDDPSIFEVTYRGRHTCIQASYAAPTSAVVVAAAASEDEPSDKTAGYESSPPPPQVAPPEKLGSFGTGLTVKTEDLDTGDMIFPSFSFPSAESIIDNSLMGSFSLSFMSPTTSDSNYFSVSPCQMNNSFGVGNSAYTPESDQTDNISAPTSVTNSPMGEYTYSLDPADFDPNIPFDDLDCFQ